MIDPRNFDIGFLIEISAYVLPASRLKPHSSLGLCEEKAQREFNKPVKGASVEQWYLETEK